MRFSFREKANGLGVIMGNREPVQSRGVSRVRGLFTRRRVVAAACLLALVATGLLSLYLLRLGPSANPRLGAIDAAHAVPEEQNAARDYALLASSDMGTFLDPQLLAQNVRTATLEKPWRSADFPEAATWVRERQAIIDTLLQAGRKPKCWFPLADGYRRSGGRFHVGYYGTLLLLRAANNDLAEGRTEAGMEKLLCVLQMAEHFRSQMDLRDRYTGMSFASEGLKRLNRLLVTEEVPQEWLARFEAALPPVRDVGDKELRQLQEIEELRVRTYVPFRQRLLRVFTAGSSARYMRQTTAAHLAEFRAARILLALRRHKERTGAWPATLAQIEGQIPPEALIDPLTRKPFVYRPAGDSLILYNVGPNRIDEGGESGDDYRFWPPSNRWAGSVKY